MKTEHSKITTGSGATQPLFQDADKESGVLDDDFLKQNDLVNQEIINNNNLLKTGPVLLYRAWLILCAVFLLVSGFIIPIYELLQAAGSSQHLLTGFLGGVALTSLYITLAAGYACILMSRALFSKSLSMAEKALKILEPFPWLSLILNGMFMIISFVENYHSSLFVNIVLVIQVAIAFINIRPSIYVTNILFKRKVFCQASSSTNKPT